MAVVRPLGPNQVALLAALGSPHRAMVVADALCMSLVKRGYAHCLRDDGFVAITPTGLHALADLLEAGRIDQSVTPRRARDTAA